MPFTLPSFVFDPNDAEAQLTGTFTMWLTNGRADDFSIDLEQDGPMLLNVQYVMSFGVSQMFNFTAPTPFDSTTVKIALSQWASSLDADMNIEFVDYAADMPTPFESRASTPMEEVVEAERAANSGETPVRTPIEEPLEASQPPAEVLALPVAAAVVVSDDDGFDMLQADGERADSARVSRWMVTWHVNTMPTEIWRRLCCTEVPADRTTAMEARQQFPIQYAAFQLECAPTTGRHHVQAYVELFASQRLNYVRKLLAGPQLLGLTSLYLQPAFKVREACARYCMKTRTRICDPVEMTSSLILRAAAAEQPAPPKEPSATCLAGQMVLAGCTPLEILRKFPQLLGQFRAMKEVEKARIESELPPNRAPIYVKVLWGPTNGGKSSRIPDAMRAQGLDPSIVFYYTATSGSTIYMDGYAPRMTILVIEEFTGQWDIDTFNRICDSRPFRVRILGSYGPYAHWQQVIFTSNMHPGGWWPGVDRERYQAAMSRMKIEYVPARDVPTRHAEEPVPVVDL